MGYEFSDGYIITDVKNPRWVWINAITVDIFHPAYGNFEFTAMPDDVVEYGREIYRDCVSGKYGEIDKTIFDPDAPVSNKK